MAAEPVPPEIGLVDLNTVAPDPIAFFKGFQAAKEVFVDWDGTTGPRSIWKLNGIYTDDNMWIQFFNICIKTLWIEL